MKRSVSSKPKRSLERYRLKRNFDQTPEPGPDRVLQRTSKKLSFVIQRHEARRLHYDLRLEASGVYKSWAVPKGLPEKSGQKALAIEVEDHPLSYGKFEGRIPEGNYGAGLVQIWDKGYYESLEKSFEEAYRKGKIHLRFAGKKAVGEWYLVKTKFSADQPQWLLIKTQEANSSKQELLKKQSARSSQKLSEAKVVKVKDWVEPMLALLTENLPRSPEWRYEVKLDGIRALAYLRGNQCELYSRNQKRLTQVYPHVIQSLKKLKCQSAILDGELIALDPAGRPSFQVLQNASDQTRAIPVFYYLFDIIALNGEKLIHLPIEKRKEKLAALIPASDAYLKESVSYAYPPEALLKEIKERGLEGVIAKQNGSFYESGQRNGIWLKYKCSTEQEFVIGGYTEPKGSRSYFGAIIVGYYEGDSLICVGKVGTGFNHENSQDLFERFQKLVTPKCPFANLPLPATVSPNWSPHRLKDYTWLKPKLVCQVKFSEWTHDSFLRQPVFLGLRIDKKAREVKREIR